MTREIATLEPSGYQLVMDAITKRICLHDTHGNYEDYRDPADGNYQEWRDVFDDSEQVESDAGCQHEPDWDGITGVGGQHNLLNIRCLLCGAATQMLLNQNDISWDE